MASSGKSSTYRNVISCVTETTSAGGSRSATCWASAPSHAFAPWPSRSTVKRKFQFNSPPLKFFSRAIRSDSKKLQFPLAEFFGAGENVSANSLAVYDIFWGIASGLSPITTWQPQSSTGFNKDQHLCFQNRSNRSFRFIEIRQV